MTEYRYHEANGFAISVEEFSDDELKHQFTDMVGNYRHHHFHSEEIEQWDRQHWADLAKLARDTFSVMFRGRFNTAMLTADEQQNQVVETLLSWARERNPVTRQSTTNTAEECAARLMRLTSEEASPQGPAAWPYIKKIRYVLT